MFLIQEQSPLCKRHVLFTIPHSDVCCLPAISLNMNIFFEQFEQQDSKKY